MLTKYFKYIIFFTLYGLRKCIRVNDSRFFFISMSGNCYGGSPRAFSDFILKQNIGIEVVWAFCQKRHIKDKRIKQVKLYSWLYYYYILSSKIICSDQRLFKSMMPHKRNEQYYIQTWHGTALKKIEADMPTINKGYENAAIKDSANIDLFVSGSTFMTKIYKKSFWYKGKFLEIGTPRNDIFFGSQYFIANKKVKDYYRLSTEKVVLYAPTFRTEDSLKAYDIDVGKVISVLQSHGERWKFFVRLHPNIQSRASQETFRDHFPNTVNASDYPDIQELLCATDLLITDYSSLMFDYMYTGKPCVILATDIADYDRGFYISVKNLPFPVAESSEELVTILSTPQKYNYKDFMDFIGSKENGAASQQLYEYLRKEVL